MTIESTHQHTCNVLPDGRPHIPAFGCRCECGATYHYLGWQKITTLPEPEN